jgi:hypothetical protein
MAGHTLLVDHTMGIPFVDAPSGAEYRRSLQVVLKALNPEVARIARADLSSLGSSNDDGYYLDAAETAERIPPTTAVELRSSMLHRLFVHALDLQIMQPKSEIEPSERDPQSEIEPNATKKGRSLAGLRGLVQSHNEVEFDRELYLPVKECDSKFVAGVTADGDGVLWYRSCLKLGQLSPELVDEARPPFFSALDEDDCRTTQHAGLSSYVVETVLETDSGVERDVSPVPGPAVGLGCSKSPPVHFFFKWPQMGWNRVGCR